MGIRLVYGLRTGDASYLDIFYPSRRLKEAALVAGLDYAAMIHNPSDHPSRILDFCCSSQEKHVALLRGEIPDTLYAYLEAAGILVINPAGAVSLARDKLRSASFFQSIGTPHPLTILVPLDSAAVQPDSDAVQPDSDAVQPDSDAVQPDSGPEQRAWPKDQSRPPVLPLPLPFVAKPRYGKMGRGVTLIQSFDQWSAYLTEVRNMRQETIVQEFIGAAPGHDIRFFFADFSDNPAMLSTTWQRSKESGSGWVCVKRSAPGFLSNAHAGGSMAAYSPPKELQAEAQRIFAASDLAYGTVDFLFAHKDESRFMVCELNANPGFEELERAMPLDAASAILSSVQRYLTANRSTRNKCSKSPASGKDGLS